MKKNVLIFLLLISIFCITACSDNSKITLENENYISPKSDKSKILVDRFTQKLVTYNTKRLEVELIMDTVNLMVYEFSPEVNLMTIGHSIDLGFEIISVQPHEVRKLFKAEPDSGLFPLVYKENDFYFTKSIYDDKSVEISRCLIKYDIENNSLIEYKNISGLIYCGAIIGDRLYYTIYNEQLNNFNLYSVDCNDFNTKAQLEKSNLKFGEIYSQNDVLYTTTESEIISNTKSFKKMEHNYFIKDEFLVQYELQQAGSINAILTDTIKNEVLLIAEEVIDFQVEDDEILFYCNGKIESYKIN